MPTSGEASQAMPVKMTNASSTFMATPATRMTSFLSQPCAENERGSSASSPSSPSSLTNPPIGSQLSVYRVSPFERRTLARGGKPMPNSSTRTPARRAVDEVAELVDDDEDPEDREEQDDRDDRLEEAGHAVPPIGPLANAARTSASRATSASTSGSAAPPAPNRSTAASSSRGIPAKSSVPSRNRATATSSAAISAAEARGPGDARLAGDAQRREPVAIGRPEVEPAGGDQVGRRRPVTAGGRGRSWRTGWGVAYPGCPAGP